MDRMARGWVGLAAVGHNDALRDGQNTVVDGANPECSAECPIDILAGEEAVEVESVGYCQN
jgi:hypothetical protein